MRIVKDATRLQLAIIGCMSITLGPPFTRGQDHGSHAARRDDNSPLVNVVRQSTERFADVAAAEAEGYAQQFGCVSGPDFGAMGLHYVNMSLVDGELDPTRPEAIIYEPLANGQLKLIGAEYVVPAASWDPTHPAPPQMMGQSFHFFEGPNRFGREAFYALHVWAWKKNPRGPFVNWHPNVSCAPFASRQN